MEKQSSQRKYCCKQHDINATSTILNRPITILILVFCVITNVSGYKPDTSTSTPTSPTTSSPTTSTPVTTTPASTEFTCRNLTNSKQRNMCYKTPGLLDVLLKAEKLAQQVCEEDFFYDKWNCSGFSMLTQSNVTKRATSESGYMYAIMSAAIAHVTTRECKDNEMKCECGENITTTSATIFTGCSKNLAYGVKIAEDFMDSAENEKGVRQLVNLQNNKVGRNMFLEQNKLKGYKCRCSGLSASCSVKTCYQGLIDFNGLAAEIKCLYKKSCLISGSSTSSKIKLVSQCNRPISNTTLVHAVSSPDYCFKDISKGSLGVKGRSCHPEATDKSNCNTVCCNRGYKEIEYIVIEKCCTFQWCCKTVCGACKKIAKKYECK